MAFLAVCVNCRLNVREIRCLRTLRSRRLEGADLQGADKLEFAMNS